MLFAAVEFAAGTWLVVAAGRGLRFAHRSRPGDAAPGREPFRHLLLLLVLLLATLSAASLLVWVFLLQSYVPQWADVRCVVGVLKVGTGSEGAAGWLPALATATFSLRGALLFAAGAGVALHLVGRDRPEGPLSRSHLGVLAAAGLLAMAGAAAETAYVVLPRTESLPSFGCCTPPPSALGALTVQRPLRPGEAGAGAALYGLPALALCFAFAARPRREEGRDAEGRGSRRPGRYAGDLLRVAGSAVVLVAGVRFVSDVIAPAHMGLPLHRCAWCLVGGAPETLLGIGLLATPLLASGWRFAARGLGGGDGPFLARLEGTLDRAALFSLLGALLFFASAWIAA